ncbi:MULTISPECIES: nuclear transport factor 2 family protein [Nocardioides]|uniref:Nuclear transport factor 2 family protein n=1 Tax=Nocardioides vastitatis TaxID=2568655 RepID=A0ABW0Z9X1_9ACTN|nr:nuclear transport factor 2 family protein [Nocardioides sp.]THJ01225.1 steroid delta-isomerase [Nocardioides sp.]
MAASRDTILGTIQRYVDLVGAGTAAEIVDLYAVGATVEDPVGSEVRSTRESILEFYSGLEGLEQQSTLLSVRIAGTEAAFQFELITKAGDQTYTLSPIDVMTFDDDGRIASMRAFWAGEDMAVS